MRQVSSDVERRADESERGWRLHTVLSEPRAILTSWIVMSSWMWWCMSRVQVSAGIVILRVAFIIGDLRSTGERHHRTPSVCV